MRSRHILLQGALHTRFPGVDALVPQLQRAHQLDDVLNGHAVTQHTRDELGVVPVLGIELLRQALDRNLVATRVLELEVIALRTVGIHLLHNLTLRHRLRQQDTLLVVLQTGEDLVGIAVEQSDERHPLLLVVLKAHHVALQHLGTHLGHVTSNGHHGLLTERLKPCKDVSTDSPTATLQKRANFFLCHHSSIRFYRFYGAKLLKNIQLQKKITTFVPKISNKKMKNLLTRRSIRRYADRDVDEQLLQRLLSEASRTQTMGNLQLYSVVVTRSPEMKKKLAPAHFNQPMVTQAPVVLTILADFNRTSTWARCRNAVPGYDNFLSFINATTDALLYTQTLCNLMDEEGLGYCYLGTTVYQPQQIIDLLHLPQLTFPVATLTVGWPDEEPAQSDRLPIEAFVHEERYNDYMGMDIDRLYEAKEALEENQNFVRINHKETLAQVFTDIRYTRKDNEAMSRTLLEAIVRQGFLDSRITLVPKII